MRVVLLMMLFQFFAPAFFSLVVQQTSHKQEANFHTRHSSVVAPLLLKEKDEKSHEKHVTVSNLAAILDLTAHSLNLKASHKEKSNYFHQALRYDPQPALFARLCTFLI